MPADNLCACRNVRLVSAGADDPRDHPAGKRAKDLAAPRGAQRPDASWTPLRRPMRLQMAGFAPLPLPRYARAGDQDHVPVCLAGKNAAPLDDMSGIPGYYAWLDALENPANELHKDAVNWLGKDFDPNGFDLNAPNRRFSLAFQPAPKKPRKGRS